MSSTFSKEPLGHLRKNQWPFRHDEFDEWPAHMRPPLHVRSAFLAFDPLTMISLAATAASTAIGAAGSIAAGDNAAAMGLHQQQEYAQQAETATATAQRSMLEERRKTGLVESTLQARAAGGGGSATSPTALGLGRQIAGRGEYNALMDLSAGQDQSAGLTNQGNTAAYGGQIAKEGDDLSAIGTIAGGAGSFAQTYRIGTGKMPGYGYGYGYGSPSSILAN